MTRPAEEELRIEVGHLKPGDVWKAKDDIAKAEWNSRKFWDHLEDHRRAALVLLVRDAMLRLLEDPDAWLPSSLEPSAGDQIDLKVSIRLPILNTDEMRRYVDLERIRGRAGTELMEALGKLRARD